MKQFALLVYIAGSTVVKFHNQSMVATGVSFPVVQASHGLAAISASYSSWFVNAGQSREEVIVVTSANPGNALLAWPCK